MSGTEALASSAHNPTVRTVSRAVADPVEVEPETDTPDPED